MATDPKENKEAKDEKPKEDLTEEQLKDVAGGRREQLQRDAEQTTRNVRTQRSSERA